ncbi:hypothetical protein POM88_033726 [Heracleum sosnowskyi]|uniref:F-box domain-containing protein n=1 Tax=Heracleum sosnowskyi TaxID=360622 RepID=A0AAD8HJW2_9APIA|nr:hypothetical protein POM88_033726 [Heracleum sosnowskyi]
MSGDVPNVRFYARRHRTTDAKRTRLDSNFVGGGVCKEGTDSKILQLDDRDWISNLHQDVVQCILEHLSVHDAAKTSVLSKEWRHKWGMKNNLVLDEAFFLKVTSNKDKDPCQTGFLRAIEMIILVHKAPVLSFNLYIPPKLDHCLVSRWMEHFLNKRIKVLEMTNSEKNVYEIPLFICEGLVELKLSTWILNPLPKPGSFTNLLKVELNNVSITGEVSFGSQLKILYLNVCTGVEHLSCQFSNANKLTDLLLRESEQIEWRWFECTKQLEAFGLALTKANPNTTKPVNLIKLLSSTPTITLLFLSGYTVEVLGPLYSMSKELAPKIENLKLIDLGYHNLCQLFNSLYLIRCLPNLQILQIILEPGAKSLNRTVEQFLEFLDWNGLLLNQLHTVAIEGVVGETTVLHFIKFLLATSPSLRVMTLGCNIKVNAHDEIQKIAKELVQYPKKSSVAKIYLSFRPL